VFDGRRQFAAGLERAAGRRAHHEEGDGDDEQQGLDGYEKAAQKKADHQALCQAGSGAGAVAKLPLGTDVVNEAAEGRAQRDQERR
jgi:hypothetical protein